MQKPNLTKICRNVKTATVKPHWSWNCRNDYDYRNGSTSYS